MANVNLNICLFVFLFLLRRPSSEKKKRGGRMTPTAFKGPVFIYRLRGEIFCFDTLGITCPLPTPPPPQ